MSEIELRQRLHDMQKYQDQLAADFKQMHEAFADAVTTGSKLKEEVARLKAGKFTEAEVRNWSSRSSFGKARTT